MEDGDKLASKGLWLVFAITLLILGGGGLGYLGYQREHAEEREAAAADQPDQAPQQVQAVCWDVPASGASDCVVSLPTAPSPDQATQYDLHAQQDMAEWAYLLFIIGAAGLVVTTAGVGFVALTLRAAREANKGFAEAAQREMRAYVSASDIHVEGMILNHSPTFGFTLKNFGATPAKHVEVKTEVVFANIPQDDADALRGVKASFRDAKWESRGTLAPTQKFGHRTSKFKRSADGTEERIPITPVVWDAFRNRKCTFIYFGVIRYRDIFGKRHWTVFRYYVRRDEIGGGQGPLVATDRNNYTT